jgi:hypothetical protein
MATIQQIRESAARVTGIDLQRMPYLIVLKRTAIRVFPDGTKVAMYYADRLKKVFTVPFTDTGVADVSNAMQHDT